MNDSITSGEQYQDFKFVTEQSSSWDYPQLREVTYISAGWNFMILFAVTILVVLSRHLSSGSVFGAVRTPFQRGSVDKNVRDSVSSSLFKYISVVVSSILLISLFLHKSILVYGANEIIYNNMSFYFDVVVAVSAAFVFNYLFMAYYAWMHNNRSLLLFHVNLHVNSLEILNQLFIPILMILLFYPYKFFCILCLVLMTLLYLMRFINFFVEIRLFSRLNFVNIFLYLCTLEIIPLLVIFKVIYDVFIAL